MKSLRGTTVPDAAFSLVEVLVAILVLGVPLFIRSTPVNLASDFTVLPLQIFNWAGRPHQEFTELAAAAIIVLLAVLLIFNAVAVLIGTRLQKLDA